MVRLFTDRRPYLNYISSLLDRFIHPYLELLIIFQIILDETVAWKISQKLPCRLQILETYYTRRDDSDVFDCTVFQSSFNGGLTYVICESRIPKHTKNPIFHG